MIDMNEYAKVLRKLELVRDLRNKLKNVENNIDSLAESLWRNGKFSALFFYAISKHLYDAEKSLEYAVNKLTVKLMQFERVEGS